MEQEYESLRQEIRAWQNRRFTTLAASITIVSGILGLDVVQESTFSGSWPILTSLLWFFLGSTIALIWYAGRANAKIAAYLIVFHEKNAGGWESRLTELKASGLDWFSLNRMVFLIFVSLGILSFVIPWSVRGLQEIPNWHTLLLLITGIWFCFGLMLLMWGYSREKYIDKWIDVATQSSPQ
ncbi:MAG TPA: hypothetical protein VKA68_05140 [bacterium]|nr:hypothetical protein [bacterium]